MNILFVNVYLIFIIRKTEREREREREIGIVISIVICNIRNSSVEDIKLE